MEQNNGLPVFHTCAGVLILHGKSFTRHKGNYKPRYYSDPHFHSCFLILEIPNVQTPIAQGVPENAPSTQSIDSQVLTNFFLFLYSFK